MSGKRVALPVVALLCFIALTPAALLSQATNTGSIAGIVTDPQGAAVVGATVTITDPTTNVSRTAVANDVGRYVFVDVPPAAYNVSISKTGFRVSKALNQKVNVGLTLTLNVTLELGSVTETVEVSATAGAELQTLNAKIGRAHV